MCGAVIVYAVADAGGGTIDVYAGERRDGEDKVAMAPRGRGDRQVVLGQRDREVDVRPRGQRTVGVEERLERARAPIGLDHAVLVEQGRARGAGHADRRPVRLFAVQPARRVTAWLSRGDGVEEVSQRAPEAERAHVEAADAEGIRARSRFPQLQAQVA